MDKNKETEIQRQDDNKAVPPLTFRLYQEIRFNRPVDKDKDYVMPGGYELEMEKEDGTRVCVQFDFEHYEGGISDEDPTIVEAMQKNPDHDFEDLNEVTGYMLRHVTKCIEWYVYTGEPEETVGFYPVEVIDPHFVLLWDANGKEFDWEHIPITVPIDVSNGTENTEAAETADADK